MIYGSQKVIKTNSQARSFGNKAGSDWRGRIWNSNIFSFFLVILLILSFVKVSKEVILRYEINKEIKELETQLGELEDKNQKMEQLVAYLNTEEYVEKQARLKLNLSKPGEKQIFLTGNESVDDLEVSGDDSPNIMKWYDYFFN
ncbi:MAG: septum formation initiator family protein [bacterium]|nr:septum formation initiator family protein [bacterium]